MTARTEEEELTMIRNWWQQNGTSLLTGVALALALVFGWEAWQNYQSKQKQTASMLYQQLLEATLAPGEQVDPGKVATLSGQLQKDFAGSAYAQYGDLFVAKVAVDNGNLVDAASALQRVMDKPADPSLAELARQRLARVMAAQGKVDEGLALLAGDTDQAFLGPREELRGDLLVQAGQPSEARAAYEKAMAAQSNDGVISAIQMKIDNLAQGDE